MENSECKKIKTKSFKTPINLLPNSCNYLFIKTSILDKINNIDLMAYRDSFISTICDLANMYCT